MAMGWRRMRRLLRRDALLRQVGLEQRTPRSDFFTGLGLFSVGVLVGAGMGLLFAPKRGEDMRATMGDAWRRRAMERGSRLAEVAHHVGSEAGIPPTTQAEH